MHKLKLQWLIFNGHQWLTGEGTFGYSERPCFYSSGHLSFMLQLANTPQITTYCSFLRNLAARWKHYQHRWLLEWFQNASIHIMTVRVGGKKHCSIAIQIKNGLLFSLSDEQSIPLYKALSYGAASVEADIYLVDDQLLVSGSSLSLLRLRMRCNTTI